MNSSETIDSYPLSPMQQGMLYRNLYSPTPGLDIEQVLVVLPEPLLPHLIEKKWKQVLQRHTVLRTAFRWEGLDEARQEVRKNVDPEIHIYDLRELSSKACETRIEDLLIQDRQRGFELDKPPLWRMMIIQSKAERFQLVFTFHHIILDGYSLQFLLRETLLHSNSPKQLEESPPPYRNYIDWLKSFDYREAENYWREYLKGFSRPTPLPGASAQSNFSNTDTTLHKHQCTRIPENETLELRRFARKNRCNLNTLSLAIWALLLGRYNEEEDVTFGVVRACRQIPLKGIASLAGLVLNTVPFRIQLPPDQPVIEWLGDVIASWRSIRPHEQAPLDSIQSWSDIPHGLPLFQSIVNYQEFSWGSALNAQGGIRSDRDFENRSHPSYPLAFQAEGGRFLFFKIIYDPLRYSDTAIEQMLGHLTTLLKGIVANPQTPLKHLPLLTSAERKQILVEWNDTKVDYPDEGCVHQLIENQVRRSPHALAVSDEKSRLTYEELNTQADSIAQNLNACGIGSGDCVAICLPRSAEFVVSTLAILKCGGAFVPLDPSHPAQRLVSTVHEARAKLLITQREFSDNFGALNGSLVFFDELPRGKLASSYDAVKFPQTTPRDLAYVIYTSGSTGTPKGVAIEHRSLVNLIHWHQNAYQVSSRDRVTQIASPSFDASVWEIWPNLASGASIHIPPENLRSDPPKLISWLCQENISLTFLPTPLAEAVIDEGWPAHTSLRAIFTGGDRLRRWPMDRLPCPLINHYGPTETTVVATAGKVPAEPDNNPQPSIGAPIANTEVYVLDRHLEPLPAGVPGELYIGGAGLARGYLHQQSLTAEKFFPNPFKDEGCIYRTGDCVRWRSDGCLDFLGRLDKQIKIRGFRIEPAEIEASLNAHPDIRDSLVSVHYDENNTSQLVAYCIPRTNHSIPSPAKLSAHLRAWLPAYMVADAYIALEAWPFTPNGKIDYANLPMPSISSVHSNMPFQAPRTEMEKSVTQVWEAVLGRTQIGVQDNFFEIGGHSLRAAQIVSRLNEMSSVEILGKDLFENPTIFELACVIEQKMRSDRKEPRPPLVRSKRRTREEHLIS